MKIKFLVIIILLIFIPVVSAFAEITIKAEVDKITLSTDDTLTYKLTITTEKNIAAPKLPKFDGFEVITQVQSSTMSIAKNEMESTVVFEFVLAPQDAGKCKIEPSTLKAKGQTYSSDAFEIEVTQGKQKPQPPQEKARPESEEPQYTL
jgi:hypothetical protein